MTLDATAAAELMIRTAEEGGTAAVATAVGGDAVLLGRRLALTRGGPDGEVRAHGSLGSAEVDAGVGALLREAIHDPRARDGLHTLGTGPQAIELYIEIRRPVLELVIVGAGHIAQPMATLGSLLGYRVTVLDDRPDFATRERFPTADRIVRADFSDPFREVPLHERSHVLLVTRGHTYDYDCLVRALRVDPAPAYLGMIGSRRRVRATFVQLLEDGLDRDALARIHAPVGLDIGAETPEEIAVSVAAELVRLHRGGTGVSLRDLASVATRFFADTPTSEGA
jgi:xanthine dehydrogenase accessory factor